MAECRLLIPLLNKKVATFGGPTWYLADRVYLEKIDASDFGVVFRDSDDLHKSLVGTETKCLCIDGVDDSKVDEIVEIHATEARFVMNYFRNEAPVVLA